MEIQNFINEPIFNETISNLRNKAKENAKQAFSDLFNETKEQASNTASKNLPENFTPDNGVKSAVILGQLDIQHTNQAQNSGAMTTINLTDEELEGWHNGKLPEGWRQTNAGGVIFSGGTRKYSSELGVYYTDGADYDYQFGAFYDENSPEDNPVVYLRQIATSTTSQHYSDYYSSKTIRVEVNKVDPSNATYEEMIALAGYIYRDDPKAAFDACEAIDMTREAMQADGREWQNGPHDYTSYYLPEVVRRYKEYNPEISEAADMLLGYLKDYPRGSDKA